MISRLIQALGGSIGSVIGQAICRDAFHGAELGRVYSIVGSALALFPALGPICGGVISECFGWSYIFIFLIAFAALLIILVIKKLPETHLKNNRKHISILDITISLIKNKKTISFGLIVAGCNGIVFSYFAEGSFYLINGLDMSPTKYGLSFILLAISTMMGGITSKWLHSHHSSKDILRYGLIIMWLVSTMFSAAAILNYYIWPLPSQMMIIITIFSQMIIAFGICMATSNALALALVDYKHAIGTASSLFGFFYYCLISVITLGIGILHNGTLLLMPLYFFSICCVLLLINRLNTSN